MTNDSPVTTLPSPAGDRIFPVSFFPNSGHHYHFLPFSEGQEEGLQDANDGETHRQAAGRDQEPWREWNPAANLDPGQQSGLTNAGVRLWYRLGRRDGHAGLLLAFETNVGSRDRGTVIDVRDNLDAAVPADYRPSDTPYPFHNLTQIQLHQAMLRFFPEPGLWWYDPKRNTRARPLIELSWRAPDVETPREVDLIVDFGNSRTIAVLIEAPVDEPHVPADFNNLCKALRFMPRCTDYEPSRAHVESAKDPWNVLDSWLMLRQPVFAGALDRLKEVPLHQIREKHAPWWKFWEGESRRVQRTTVLRPHLFVELSPAAISSSPEDSPGAVLKNVSLERGGKYFLSSPKRYAWDTKPIADAGERWTMKENPWSSTRATAQIRQPALQGELFRFMDPDGRDWPPDAPPNQRADRADRPSEKQAATYPRSDAITWMALGIIEKAYAQINSPEYVKGADFVPRRLRSIRVTTPAGWTGVELANYRAKWEKAVNIFALARLGEGEPPPKLHSELDEAVAAQLPFIYSEMLRIPGGDAWIDLVGRLRGGKAAVRILNLDIGGGTTDVAVVEYHNSAPPGAVRLVAQPLFKHSTTIAGDLVVRRVIERVLLPLLASQTVTGSTDDEARFIGMFFGRVAQNVRDRIPNFEEQKARVVRLVLLPLVHYWLACLTDAGTQRTEDEPPYDVGSYAQLKQMYQVAFNRELPELEKIWPWRVVVNSQCQERIEACIVETFTDLIRSTALQAAAFDVDIVFVSGKPSELTPLRELLFQQLALPPESIIFAKDYPCGAWYPLRNAKRTVEDAKTVTAVGAALHQAIYNGWIEGWRIEVKPPPADFGRNDWGIMPSITEGPIRFEEQLCLRAKDETGSCEMLVGSRIGRRRPHCRGIMPDPVYELRWKRARGHGPANEIVTVHFRRKPDPASGSEKLQVEMIEGHTSDGAAITADDVGLELNTLPREGFWMDKPDFDYAAWTPRVS